jgi:hypothetical protein
MLGDHLHVPDQPVEPLAALGDILGFGVGIATLPASYKDFSNYDRVTDAIATVGLSTALRAKLAELELQRGELEQKLRLGDPEPFEFGPELIDGWRQMIDGLENLSRSSSSGSRASTRTKTAANPWRFSEQNRSR